MTRTAPDDVSRSSFIEAPPLWMRALESRAVVERATMTISSPFHRFLPRGDGHHVIVFPGFIADDRSTRPLRRVLMEAGYQSHGWRLGRNIGPTAEILDGLSERLQKVHTEAQAPVSLIGWSLGGIYARELARAAPEMVRQVITLGSPIQMIEEDSSAAQSIWNRLRHLHSADFKREVRAARRPPLTVPTTSIYTRTDGVVSWQASLIRRSAISENIRVYGSHTGLGFNNAAVYAMTDRLAQPEDAWIHFEPPLWAKAAFPPARDLDVSRLP